MPSLPLDLERLIFEMAALQDIDHGRRVQLILVAKRVYEWIRPILYRVVIVGSQLARGITIRDWRTAQVAPIAPFARHLLVSSNSTSLVIETLSVFRNVENLALWCHGSVFNLHVLDKLNDLPLRILSIGLDHAGLGTTIEHCPAFMNITHLEIFAMREPIWNDLKALVDLPKLTHLCLDPLVRVEDQVILNLLEHCPSLRAMIYLTVDKLSIEPDGIRFLILQDGMRMRDIIAEWEISAHGEIGLWELADMIIFARKNRFFSDNCSFAFSRSTWMDKLNEDGRRWYKEWSRGAGIHDDK